MLIRVGLDQWITVAGTNPQSQSPGHLVGLNTAGLSGCVAIGLGWGDLITLAHVYSDCSQQTWLPNGDSQGYLHALNAAFDASRSLRPHVTEPDGMIVFSDGTPEWLPRQIGQWLYDRGANIERGVGATCRVWVQNGQFRWAYQLAENPNDYNKYTTSQNAAAPILSYAALSAAAAPASPPQGE